MPELPVFQNYMMAIGRIQAIREPAIFVLAEARMIFRKVGKLRDRALDRNSPEFVATILGRMITRSGGPEGSIEPMISVNVG